MSTVGVIQPVMAALFLLSVGCGGSPPPDRDEVFRTIQVHEASIAHGSAEAERCPADGECPAAAQVCEAAEALCAEAERLEDADAAARCELGQRRCRAVQR